MAHVINPPDHAAHIAQYRNLCGAVGFLFISFAVVENKMTGVLKMHLARNIDANPKGSASVALASAIYGGMRFSNSRDAMKRVLKIEKAKPETLGLFTALFTQIGEIQRLRDLIAHQILDPAPGNDGNKWLIRDFLTTKFVSEQQTFEITISDIEEAARDLEAACNFIGGLVGRNVISNIPDGIELPAWRYKPAMLKRLK